MQNILCFKVKQNYIKGSSDYEQIVESYVTYEKLFSLCKIFPFIVICSNAGYQMPLVFPVIVITSLSHQIPKYCLENHTAPIRITALEDIYPFFGWKNFTILKHCKG